MLDGKIYSDLSTGEKILVNLRINEQLQKYYGVEVPVLVDNAEAITRKIKTGAQLLTFSATKGAEIEGVTKIKIKGENNGTSET